MGNAALERRQAGKQAPETDPAFPHHMTRACALLFILAAAGASCSPLAMDIDSKASLEEGLAVRAALEWEQSVFRILYARDQSSRESVSAGFVLPWICMSPLSPAGLLRETENPLGFSVGSGVFREASGIEPDGSLDSMKKFGLMIAPIPERVFLFMTQGPDDVPHAGFLAGFWGESGAGFDAAIEMAEPRSCGLVDDWFFDSLPWPGGPVAHAACRAGFRSPLFSVQMSGCVSGSQTAPPGGFIHAYSAAGAEGWGIDAFFGIASREYRTLKGRSSRWGKTSGLSAHFSDELSAASIACSISVGFPDFSHPFLPTRRTADFFFERSLAAKRSAGPRLRVDASVGADFDSDGRRSGNADGTLTLAWMSGREKSRLMACFSEDGARMLADLRYPLCGGSIRLEGGLAAEGRAAATAILGARLPVSRGSLIFRAGFEDMPLEGEITASCFRLDVEWSAGSVVGFP
jgi:hypothetical protein